jgi:hypothetical protein
LAQRGRNFQSRLRSAGVALREGPSVRKRDYGQRVKGADAVVEQRLSVWALARDVLVAECRAAQQGKNALLHMQSRPGRSGTKALPDTPQLDRW